VPTYSRTDSFFRDYKSLDDNERKQFKAAVKKFVADLRRGNFRKGLRVKGVEGSEGVFEMTWAKDGRATFQYGTPIKSEEPHVIWRRCGGHRILSEP
jgi:hypothetical protein